MSELLTIRPATAEDAVELAKTMRPEDAAEVYASGGFDPATAVLESFRLSVNPQVALIDGELAAMWGVAPINLATGFGVVWMLTGAAVWKAPLLFLRASKREVERLASHWNCLVNAIDARYERAVRWAKWLGLKVDAPRPFGFLGLPFHHIQIGG